MKFNEIIEGKIIRESSDDGQRTVIAGVLEGDFLSANKRFYPESIVRKASETLVGKASMIGHDTNSPRDVVARITSSMMNGKKLIASFKFGTDASSNEMFTKVKEGLVDSYSIRAYGSSKEGMINGEVVDIVQEMDIETIDLVVTPGISSAKVLKVFESSPQITYKENDNMDEVKELQAKLDEAAKQLKASEDARLALESDKQKAEEARLKAELDSKISEDLATVLEDYRAEIKEDFSGKTKEDWSKHFESRKKSIEKILKKAKVSETVVISPKDKKDEKKSYRTVNDTLESSDLSKDDKKNILVSMLGGKVK